MFKTTEALILREATYKDADRIVTLFTTSDGIISAKAKGALRKKSPLSAATQQLTYSEVTLFYNKDRWTVTEATVKEAFDGLRTDLNALSLGCYISECLENIGSAGDTDSLLLQLGLNTLYAVSRRLYPFAQIKAIFELRAACIAGYTPDYSCCASCGASCPEEFLFSIPQGRCYCTDCAEKASGICFHLNAGQYQLLRAILSAPAKKIFSFSVTEREINVLSELAEKYFVYHMGRHFGTLDYYKSLISFV